MEASAAPVARVMEPTPPWLEHVVVRELDVRPELEQGAEPFVILMTALRQLAPGEVLTVLAPFEPAPLRRLMQDRGC